MFRVFRSIWKDMHQYMGRRRDGEVWGLSYETPGYQDSRNDSKMGNVFSAFFKNNFFWLWGWVGQKSFFAKKIKSFFSLGRCRLAEWGRLPLSWRMKCVFFCGQSPLFFNVLNIGNKNHKIPLCHIWSHLTSWGPSWNGAACWKHFVKLIMMQLKRKMTIMMRTRILLTTKRLQWKNSPTSTSSFQIHIFSLHGLFLRFVCSGDKSRDVVPTDPHSSRAKWPTYALSLFIKISNILTFYLYASMKMAASDVILKCVFFANSGPKLVPTQQIGETIKAFQQSIIFATECWLLQMGQLHKMEGASKIVP